jgi:hypothetical protein
MAETLSGDLLQNLADEIERVLAGDPEADRAIAEGLLPVYEDTLASLRAKAAQQTGADRAATRATISVTREQLFHIREVLARDPDARERAGAAPDARASQRRP